MTKYSLIVDDSSTIRKIIRQSVESFGFACGEAEDGQKALDACHQRMPDLIMLDWNMPVMNGLEFLRHLRASEGGDKPVVIFCTTENEMDAIMTALQAGANEYIMKPFHREVLESKIIQLGLLDATSQ